MNHAQLTREMIPNSLPDVAETDLPRSHGTILLVEDETFLLEVTCEISGVRRLSGTENPERGGSDQRIPSIRDHSATADDRCRFARAEWP